MTNKYVIIIPDGAADNPIEQFGNKTVLETADKPNMDKISQTGRLGIVQTVPEGMDPGSDVAQMSLLGYDPRTYYTGRAPIEAVARNVQLSPDDWVFRCNLVTFADGKMADHSAGHISTEEGAKLITELNEQVANDKVRFYTGVSYRHLLVLKGFDFDVKACPPHDYIGTPVEKILPRGKGADFLIDLMVRSQQFFLNHDINRVRTDLNENPVSSIWLWGQGKKARLESFEKRFGLKGAAITAVDLVRGLAKLIGFDLIEVPGATGFIDTNFQGKGEAAINALEKYDIVVVHIEAPDEAGHLGNAELKKKAVEQIDKYIVGPVYEAIQKFPDWRIMVLPDHPTPVQSASHCGDPVPFAMAGTNISGVLQAGFTEPNARQSGLRIENGYELMEYFLKN
ncbi:MAG: cofactor-independent phosphoglycerate mutase [Sedimentisphaerales bacterium]|nr:cofactor-independent phosphoglycerate mutase [Sedimentisphaerales bacterium]